MVSVLQAIADTLDENIMAPLGGAIGQPVDQVRLILVFFALYPIGWF